MAPSNTFQKQENPIMTSSDDEKNKNYRRDSKKDKHKFRTRQVTSESDISDSDGSSSSSDQESHRISKYIHISDMPTNLRQALRVNDVSFSF